MPKVCVENAILFDKIYFRVHFIRIMWRNIKGVKFLHIQCGSTFHLYRMNLICILYNIYVTVFVDIWD